MVRQTQPTASVTSLAEAMRNTRPVDTQPQDNALENLVSQGGVNPGFDSPEQKAKFEEEQQERNALQARSQEINSTKEIDILTAADVAEQRDMKERQHWVKEIAALIKQKNMPVGVAPKVVDARIVSAGVSDNRLLTEAERTVKNYNPEDSNLDQSSKSPLGLWKSRQKKLRGYRQTASVQNDLTNNESNIHRGGGQ